MRRFLTLCLATLVFGAMLSTSALGAEGVTASGKAQAVLAWDDLNLGATLTDTNEGDIDELSAPVFLASWDASASGLVSPSAADGPRRRTGQSIRAPPQYL
ncbi:hypothetical protein [Halomonas elongata]|uniref:hypothetical protein n=1 Tax=Halomonas elongata TaxID=2746 RepID=UPI0023AEF20C|nr:hypothetical protein [Halomonas elongata]